jgi:hypothetical protein
MALEDDDEYKYVETIGDTIPQQLATLDQKIPFVLVDLIFGHHCLISHAS